jgi:high-affinity nickel-transport protein
VIDLHPTAILGLGFLLGIRHALDADHLAAVSTIVSERKSVTGSALVGAVWGLGHTASLLGVAFLMIGLRMHIPATLARGFELAVAAMLVGLGLNLLLWGKVRAARPRSNRRPFFVGLMHGLAGSAGLMLAVLATVSTPSVALAYVGTFGIGSIGGMMVMSMVLGLPIALAAGRFTRAEGWLQTSAAVGSVGVGLLLAWEVTTQTGIPL